MHRLCFIAIVWAILFIAILFIAILPLTALAAPLVEIPRYQIQMDVTYAPSKNTTAYFNTDRSNETRHTDGNLTQYAVTYALSNHTALNLIGTEMNFIGYTDINGTSIPNMFVVDLQLQQRLCKGLALFAGYKHVTGYWQYSSSEGTAKQYHLSKDEAEFGAVLSIKIAKNLTSFAKIGFSPSTTQYKLGLQYALTPYTSLEAGYHRLQIRGIQNPQFASNAPPTDFMDVTAGGPFLGIRGVF